MQCWYPAAMPIVLWDAATGKLLRTLAVDATQTGCITFSPDGTMLATFGDQKNIHLWDAATGERLRTLPGRVDAIAFSPDGRTLAIARKNEVGILLLCR